MFNYCKGSACQKRNIYKDIYVKIKTFLKFHVIAETLALKNLSIFSRLGWCWIFQWWKTRKSWFVHFMEWLERRNQISGILILIRYSQMLPCLEGADKASEEFGAAALPLFGRFTIGCPTSFWELHITCPSRSLELLPALNSDVDYRELLVKVTKNDTIEERDKKILKLIKLKLTQCFITFPVSFRSICVRSHT